MNGRTALALITAFAAGAALIVAGITLTSAALEKSGVEYSYKPAMEKWLEAVLNSDFQNETSKDAFIGSVKEALREERLAVSTIEDPETGETKIIAIYIDGTPKMWISNPDMIAQFEDAQIPLDKHYEKGTVSTKAGDKPFYTNSTDNPVTVNLKANETKRVSFWVYPTGKPGRYRFYAYANVSSDPSNSAASEDFQVTIIPKASSSPVRPPGAAGLQGVDVNETGGEI